MSLSITQPPSIAPAIRRFGVNNYDNYWVDRQRVGTTRQTRLHDYLVSLTDRLVRPGSRVLDCGVGPGHVYRLLTAKHDTYGVEISDEAFSLYDFDTSRISKADLNQGIPDFGVTFDVIIASMIIHHLEDPPAFLQQVRERLAPGGFFIPVIPNVCYAPYRFGYFFLGKFPPISHAHRNFQTATEFEGLVKQANYTQLHRLTPKKKIRARLWPTWFSQDLVYVFQANS